MSKTKIRNKPHAVADLEARIVQHIHATGGVSRVELARSLDVVASTSGIYVDRLLEQGILTEAPAVQRGMGRPPCLLHLNPRAGRFVGVDFDARQLQVVVVDFCQSLLVETQHTIPARCDSQGVLNLIADVVREAVGSRKSDVLGIGLGVPGPVDAERGIAVRYAHFRDWNNVPIGPQLAQELEAPTFVENNLRSMALAELHAPSGRGLRNFVCLGVRSGIGSGIIVDGRLLTGATNQAGEIGRWSLPDWSRTASGGAATIEEVASLSALLQMAQLANVGELLSRLRRGESSLVRMSAEAARVHAWALHHLDAVFDPERLIIAGPLVESPHYTDALFAAAETFGGVGLKTRLRCSELGKFAGARGAAALAFQHWKPHR